MRPRLKSDTFYIPVEDGVYLRNNEKSFVLKGKTVASWMERLAPLLNGSYDLEDLCQRVPVEKRPMIEKLVGILAEHGYVKDTALDQPHTLTDDIQQTYGPAIAYIDYHLDSGAYRFQQFLDLPVLAMGSGDALVALAHALLETGNRQIHLLDTHEETTDYGRINELLAILQADRDASLSLHTLTLGGWDDEHLLAALAPFKVVIYFTACGSLALVNRLAAVCYRAGVIFLPAVTLENEIIIGPTQKPNTTGCWQCFWRRRQSARGLSTLDEHGSPALPPAFSVSPSQPGGTAIAVAANLLAFEFFKQGTGIHTETLDGQVFVLEMERLQSVTHTVFAHPLCRICAPLFSTVSPDSVPQAQWVCDEIAALRCYQSALEPRELAQQVEQWVDAYCGIFTRLNEQDYYQLPLVRSQVTIAAPSSEGTLPKVSAAALDYQEARLILVREALSLYLSSLADSRRTIRASYEQLREHHEAIHPHQFFGWTGNHPSEPIAWQWAYRLDDEQPVLVPAAAVHPGSLWNCSSAGPLFRQGSPGIGVGASFHEALARGLQSIGKTFGNPSADTTTCSAQGCVRLIARHAYAGDGLCAVYLRMLDILGREVVLVDLTGPLGLPRVAALLDGHLVEIAAHWESVAAARDALKAAVLAIQIERFPSPEDQRGSAPPVTEALSLPLSDMQIALALPASLAQEAGYQEACQSMLERFRTQGWDVLVVPIGTDITIARAAGCALSVIAVRRDRKAAVKERGE